MAGVITAALGPGRAQLGKQRAPDVLSLRVS